VPNYGDWQLKTNLDGLTGMLPKLPMSYPELEREAEQKLSAQLWSYVAGAAEARALAVQFGVAAFEAVHDGRRSLFGQRAIGYVRGNLGAGP
jgi:hypothetical protein